MFRPDLALARGHRIEPRDKGGQTPFMGTPGPRAVFRSDQGPIETATGRRRGCLSMLVCRLSPAALAAAPDARLVALARAGDERAFAAILDRYRGPLARYCRRFLGPAAADDALQQTFINAHAALTSPDASVPLALKPWLYRVARNAALNLARVPQLEPVPDDFVDRDAPDEIVDRRETFSRVLHAVAALPESQREVIVRHELAGESHEHIAAELGMSPGAIRQLAFRARGTLRAAA